MIYYRQLRHSRWIFKHSLHISFSDQSYLILSYLISWCMFRTRSLIDTTLENNNMYIELQQIIKFYLRHLRQCFGISEHVERDGVWQYPPLDWAWGYDKAGGNKDEEGVLPRLTCHSCLPPAGNSLAISSRCCVPTSSRRARACSSSFRCGHLLVVCPHPSTRGGAMMWQLCGRLWCCDMANDPTAAQLEPLT